MSSPPDASPPRRGRGAGRSLSRRDARRYAASGAATVAAIYAVGYAATQPVGAPDSGPSTNAVGHTQPSSGRAATPGSRAPGTTGSTAATGGYRDGRFTGTGTSPYGDLSVAVAVRGGRIASVEVTGATTFFPANAVAPLVPEVVSRQSADVDVVSGATGSSQAFQGAVQHALAQARA